MFRPTFIRFDSTACAFPRPRLNFLPYTSKLRCFGKFLGSWRTILDGQNVSHFSLGRYALHEAYRRAVYPQGAVILPSYHCRTMVDPALNLGLRVLFYSLTENLSPELRGLASLLKAEREFSTNSSLLLVLPDYFGFVQPLDEVRDLCKSFGVKLLRDRSHALFLEPMRASAIEPTETLVASPYKFIGSEDGGCLIQSAKDTEPVTLHRPDCFAEGRAWVRLVRNRWIAVRPCSDLDPERLPEELGRLLSKSWPKGEQRLETTLGPSEQFVASDVERCSLAASRWLLTHADLDYLAERRRRNYKLLADAVASIPNCYALFPELPDDCVPYMFPLYLEAPDLHFYLLKRIGVPVGRWDELAVSDCPVAGTYRLRLIHLPCHQGLDLAEMAWLITALSTVLSIGP